MLDNVARRQAAWWLCLPGLNRDLPVAWTPLEVAFEFHDLPLP